MIPNLTMIRYVTWKCLTTKQKAIKISQAEWKFNLKNQRINSLHRIGTKKNIMNKKMVRLIGQD